MWCLSFVRSSSTAPNNSDCADQLIRRLTRSISEIHIRQLLPPALSALLAQQPTRRSSLPGCRAVTRPRRTTSSLIPKRPLLPLRSIILFTVPSRRPRPNARVSRTYTVTCLRVALGTRLPAIPICHKKRPCFMQSRFWRVKESAHQGRRKC